MEGSRCTDDVRQNLDTRTRNGNDERRSSGVGGGAKARVIGGGVEADDEDTEDVEDENADVDLLNGAGDRATRVLGLGGGDGDDLGAKVAEVSASASRSERKQGGE